MLQWNPPIQIKLRRLSRINNQIFEDNSNKPKIIFQMDNSYNYHTNYILARKSDNNPILLI